MIIDKLSNCGLCIKKFPELSEAFDFIISRSGKPEDGKYDIDENMYASVGVSEPKSIEDRKLEAHKKYIDLQYVIDGQDVIGWKHTGECSDIRAPYDEVKDIVFYGDKPDFDLVLNEGKFALLFPDDAHAPLCGTEPVRKCIIKIKTELILK